MTPFFNLINKLGRPHTPKPPARRQAIVRICLSILLLLLLLVTSAVVLTKGLSHDEHMYLSAARLLDSGSIYTDFAYLQTPYMPYVYHFMINIFNSGYILATGRATKLIIVTALVLVFFQLASCLSSDRWFALTCLFIIVENNIFRHNLGLARNHVLPMLLVLIGVYSFVSSWSYSRTTITYTAIGILSGLAIGTKLTYALVPIAIALPVFIKYGVSKHSISLMIKFSFGLVLGLLPLIYLCINAGFDRVFFYNVGYHNLNYIVFAEAGNPSAMSFMGKLQNAKHTLFLLPNQFLLLLSLFIFFLIVMEKHRGFVILKSQPVICCGVLVFVSIAMFLIPAPVWPAYYFPFVICLALLTCALYSKLSAQSRKTAKNACLYKRFPSHSLSDSC